MLDAVLAGDLHLAPKYQLFMIMLLVYSAKHLIADYALQLPFKYMYGKFKPGLGYVLPLASHCAVHAVMTFGIVWSFVLVTKWHPIPELKLEEAFPVTFSIYAALILSGFDFIVHFWMDRIKASPHLLGHFKTVTAQDWMDIQKIIANKKKKNTLEMKDAKRRLRHNFIHWFSLGVDQECHHNTHYFIIFALLFLGV